MRNKETISWDEIISRDENIYLSRYFANNGIELDKFDLAVLLAISYFINGGVKNKKYYTTGFINVKMIMAFMNLDHDKNYRNYKKVNDSVNQLIELGVIQSFKCFDEEFTVYTIKKDDNTDEEKKVSIYSAIPLRVVNKVFSSKKQVATKIGAIAFYIHACMDCRFVDDLIKNEHDLNNFMEYMSHYINKKSVESIGLLYGVSRQTARKHFDLLIKANAFAAYTLRYDGGVKSMIKYVHKRDERYLVQYLDQLLKERGNSFYKYTKVS